MVSFIKENPKNVSLVNIFSGEVIPLVLDVTLVLLGPVILVISLFLRVLLVLMVPVIWRLPWFL